LKDAGQTRIYQESMTWLKEHAGSLGQTLHDRQERNQ